MNRLRKTGILLAAVLALSLIGLAQEDEDKALRLAIGDAKLKDKVLEIKPGVILAARNGKPLALPKMILEMESSRFVYVGESHDSMPMHDIQLRVIQALFERDKNIALGLEMLPAEVQPVLDRWSQGFLSRDAFVREVRWYIHWNMNFGFYEKIFDFARENQIPIYALNVPRDLITKIRMKGWESLSEEEKKQVPEPDLGSQDHRTLIRTIFESTELPHQMKGEGLEKAFEGLYRAQAAWDGIMAANTIRGSEEEKRRMIVLAGSGHLLYNLGINRRVLEKNRLPSKTVVVVALSPEEKSVSVSRSLADYIWGILEEERPTFPSVGLAFKKIEGMENLIIERKPFDGVAKGGDFEKGDIILAIGGERFTDLNEARIFLARFKWDEETKIRLLRNGEVKEVTLGFSLKPQAERGNKASAPISFP